MGPTSGNRPRSTSRARSGSSERPDSGTSFSSPADPALGRDIAPLEASPPLKKPPSPTRVKARELGLQAEKAAADHLTERGFVMLASNVRAGRYEIDLLAADGPVLVVVEVRARGPGSLVRPLDSVDARKRARVRSAGRQLWRTRFAKDRRFERMRFDCVAVTVGEGGDVRVEHVRAAF